MLQTETLEYLCWKYWQEPFFFSRRKISTVRAKCYTSPKHIYQSLKFIKVCFMAYTMNDFRDVFTNCLTEWMFLIRLVEIPATADWFMISFISKVSLLIFSSSDSRKDDGRVLKPSFLVVSVLRVLLLTLYNWELQHQGIDDVVTPSGWILLFTSR